ncbi:uncharacterized protein LOC124933520 [Impatiens glandulifera]|uniref:uncharacterized protein LOC124933520 n=1 Tax=Impatiens glandulifera TaxID=253017 RepID=UPI001FB12C25|nr:uncharacterized protein LOC124933520 [Impatiens glandulifera]
MDSKPFIIDISSDDDNDCRDMRGEEMDDDCVILDGDPDKPVFVDNHSSILDSDDLLLLGVKGQIACRDFPHPRHLCANYNFASTPHSKHCSQCYCYVCDATAPCLHWGNGNNLVDDHCNATDEPYWRFQRDKQRVKASHQDPKIINFFSKLETSKA